MPLAALYTACTLVVTWPLATMPTTAIAADFGDATFIAWVMSWVADHLTAVLQGDAGAWEAMWQAPIFTPEPNTLAYSEHHIGQTLQVLPLYWVANQPLLAFNVIYVLTFALTGTAAHCLARQWSGSHIAGVVAGITCAFNEYRLHFSMSHLHALSIHWWLFGLWGIDRFTATRSRWALAGATASLVLLHLSSNYLMAFCAPFTAAFAVWSLARHGRLRDPWAWLALSTAGLFSVAAVLPLLLRYLAVQQALGFTRDIDEVIGNSTSVAAFRIVMPWLGPLLGMAVLGVLVPSAGPSPVSRKARAGLLGMIVAALVLSMGPVMTLGHLTWPGPYRLLADFVPGFGGLRVPNRFLAIALSLAAVLAGIGTGWLARWRLGFVAVVLLTVLSTRTVLMGFTINRVIPSFTGLAPPPEYLRPAASPPPIYDLARSIPPEAIVAELPFGDTAYEIRYTFFTRAHGRRIVNGYSGLQPRPYLTRLRALANPLADVDAAWAALSPATHVIVHPAAWTDDTGARVRAWLESRGATPIGTRDGAWLYALPVQ